MEDILAVMPPVLVPDADILVMKKHDDLLQKIEADVEYTRHLIGKDALDPRVMDAIKQVPRDEFVPPGSQAFAYDNIPLPIGEGQTISQPYIVALMTDLLALKEDHVVLEIGAGSGYQAAILAKLTKKVYTVEIIKELGEQAAQRLRRLGYDNVEIRIGDGYQGWPEHAPYDAIIVTAAAPHIPPPLLEQLKPDGKLVIPVGGWLMGQSLVLVEKDKDGKIKKKNILAVAFVPLTGNLGENHSKKV